MYDMSRVHFCCEDAPWVPETPRGIQQYWFSTRWFTKRKWRLELSFGIVFEESVFDILSVEQVLEFNGPN